MLKVSEVHKHSVLITTCTMQAKLSINNIIEVQYANALFKNSYRMKTCPYYLNQYPNTVKSRIKIFILYDSYALYLLH